MPLIYGNIGNYDAYVWRKVSIALIFHFHNFAVIYQLIPVPEGKELLRQYWKKILCRAWNAKGKSLHRTSDRCASMKKPTDEQTEKRAQILDWGEE